MNLLSTKILLMKYDSILVYKNLNIYKEHMNSDKKNV
jgi:hypothetical protein